MSNHHPSTLPKKVNYRRPTKSIPMKNKLFAKERKFPQVRSNPNTPHPKAKPPSSAWPYWMKSVLLVKYKQNKIMMFYNNNFKYKNRKKNKQKNFEKHENFMNFFNFQLFPHPLLFLPLVPCSLTLISCSEHEQNIEHTTWEWRCLLFYEWGSIMGGNCWVGLGFVLIVFFGTRNIFQLKKFFFLIGKVNIDGWWFYGILSERFFRSMLHGQRLIWFFFSFSVSFCIPGAIRFIIVRNPGDAIG